MNVKKISSRFRHVSELELYRRCPVPVIKLRGEYDVQFRVRKGADELTLAEPYGIAGCAVADDPHLEVIVADNNGIRYVDIPGVEKRFRIHASVGSKAVKLAHKIMINFIQFAICVDGCGWNQV